MRAETVTMTRQRGTDERRVARRRVAATTVATLVGLGAVAGTASAGEQAATEPAPGGTVTVVEPADPGSLDPHLSVFVSTNRVNSFAYETLVYLGQDGEVTPGLAESWEESPTSVTYTLKDGVTCADGTPLTATTVADNFSFVADPANQSPLLGLYVPPGITVEADDAARTVTLTSEAPVPFMLQNTGAGLFIVCAAGLADRSILAAGRTAPSFVLEEAVANDHYTFSAREDYTWGPDGATSELPGFPSEVVVRIIENESTAANLLLSGEVDIAIWPVPIASGSRTRATSSPSNEAIVGEFFFNQMEGLPTADVAVRQALIGSLDLQELMSVQTAGNGELATGLAERSRRPARGTPSGRSSRPEPTWKRPGNCSTKPAG